MSRPISSAALPIRVRHAADTHRRELAGGAAILALLVVMPNRQWIMSALLFCVAQ